VLAAIGFITAFARHFFNLRHQGITRPSILVVSAILTLALIWAMAPARPDPSQAENVARVDDEVVAILVETHCQACHADKPAHPAFQAPPAGIVLGTLEQLREHADQVYQATVATEYMPLGNTTGITREERDMLGAWLRQAE
jgi:uncharacterized membrane protein